MDLYEILRVEKNANQSEIKRSYRNLSMKLHPDRGGNPRAFAEISRAYEVLSDPDKRAAYDEGGEIPGVNSSPVIQAIHAAMMESLSTKSADFIATVINKLESKKSPFADQKKGAMHAIDRIRKRSQKTRGGKEKGRSIVKNWLEKQAVSLEKFCQEMDASIAIYEEAIDLINGVKCDEEIEMLFESHFGNVRNGWTL